MKIFTQISFVTGAAVAAPFVGLAATLFGATGTAHADSNDDAYIATVDSIGGLVAAYGTRDGNISLAKSTCQILLSGHGWTPERLARQMYLNDGGAVSLDQEMALVAAAVRYYCPSAGTPGQRPSPQTGTSQSGSSADVQGLVQGAVKGQACSNFSRFRFGKTSTGDSVICVSSDVSNGGTWAAAPPLVGTRTEGSSCNPAVSQAAQSPDGIPMICIDIGGVWERHEA